MVIQIHQDQDQIIHMDHLHLLILLMDILVHHMHNIQDTGRDQEDQLLIIIIMRQVEAQVLTLILLIKMKLEILGGDLVMDSVELSHRLLLLHRMDMIIIIISSSSKD